MKVRKLLSKYQACEGYKAGTAIQPDITRGVEVITINDYELALNLPREVHTKMLQDEENNKLCLVCWMKQNLPKEMMNKSFPPEKKLTFEMYIENTKHPKGIN